MTIIKSFDALAETIPATAPVIRKQSLVDYLDHLSANRDQFEQLPERWENLPNEGLNLIELNDIGIRVSRAINSLGDGGRRKWRAYMQEHFNVFDDAIADELLHGAPYQVVQSLLQYKHFHAKPSAANLQTIESNIIIHNDGYNAVRLSFALELLGFFTHLPVDDTLGIAEWQLSKNIARMPGENTAVLFTAAANLESLAGTDLPFSQKMKTLVEGRSTSLSGDAYQNFFGKNTRLAIWAGLWFNGENYVSKNLLAYARPMTSAFETRLSGLFNDTATLPLKSADPLLPIMAKPTSMAFQVGDRTVHLEVDMPGFFNMRCDDQASVYDGRVLFFHALMQRLYPDRVFVRLPASDFAEAQNHLGDGTDMGQIATRAIRHAARLAYKDDNRNGFIASFDTKKGLSVSPL